MREQSLQEILKAKAKDGQITCAECTEIAEENNISLNQVGKTADELGIKITACQLGCF